MDFFGLVVIVPLLATTFSGIPGKSVLAAALILSIMILPTIILVSKAAIDAFIGPSGCGKSAFIKSLNRMNDLVEDCKIKGKILFDGKNIYKDYDVNVLRKKVGMVFQKPNPFPMSIYDNITFDPKTHGIKKKSKLDEIVESSLRDAVL